MISYDGIFWSGENTKITLANTKVFDSSNGSEIMETTVDQVLTAGTVVEGGIDPTVLTPAFSTTTYTGNSSQSKTIVTGIDNTSKSLVWVKSRTAAENHSLFDTERGIYTNGEGEQTLPVLETNTNARQQENV